MIAIAIVLSLAEPTLHERQLVEQAMTCRNATSPDPYRLLSFLRMEELAGVHEEARGIVLATACVESGYLSAAMGDCNYGYRRCQAHGMMQLWPWWERRYNVDRFNAHHSVSAYLHHVTRQLAKATRLCRVSGAAAWRVAEVRAVRAAGHKRCRQQSAHWKLLKRWAKRIRKANEERLLQSQPPLRL